jgi:hypothetical protein
VCKRYFSRKWDEHYQTLESSLVMDAAPPTPPKRTSSDIQSRARAEDDDLGPPPEAPKLAVVHSAPSASVQHEEDLEKGLSKVPLKRNRSDPGHVDEHAPQMKTAKEEKSYLRGLRKKFSTRGRRTSWAPAPVFYCGICLENNKLEDCFFYASCTAQHKYCRDCLGGYCRVQIVDGVTDLMCPHPDKCSGQASDAEVQSLVDAPIYEKYVLFKDTKLHPDMRVCGVCQRHCYGGSKEAPLITCECGATFCFLHDRAHPTSTCAEYAVQIRQAEKASARLVATLARKCPQCGVDTIKNGGCNHMTCAKCKASFCFVIADLFVLTQTTACRLIGAGCAVASWGKITSPPEIYSAVRGRSFRRGLSWLYGCRSTEISALVYFAAALQHCGLICLYFAAF